MYSAASSFQSFTSVLPPPQVFGTAKLYQSLLSEQCRDKGVICKLFLESSSKTLSSTSSSCGCFFDSTDESCSCPYSHIRDGELLVIPNSICRFSSTKGKRCLGQKCTFFHGTKEQFDELKRKKRQKSKSLKNKKKSPTKDKSSLFSFSDSLQLGLSSSLENTSEFDIPSSDDLILVDNTSKDDLHKDGKNCSSNNTNVAMMYRPQDYLPIKTPPEELKLCNIELFLSLVSQMYYNYANNTDKGSSQELFKIIASFTPLQMQLYRFIQEQHRLNTLLLNKNEDIIVSPVNKNISNNNISNNNANTILPICTEKTNNDIDLVILKAPNFIGSNDFYHPYVTNNNNINYDYKVADSFQFSFLNQNQMLQEQLQQLQVLQGQQMQQIRDQPNHQQLHSRQSLQLCQYNQYVPQVHQLQQSSFMQDVQQVQPLNYASLVTNTAVKPTFFFPYFSPFSTNINSGIKINNNILLNENLCLNNILQKDLSSIVY